MGKTLRRIIKKSIDTFNYLIKIIDRVFKTLVQSLVICFPVILTLVLINSLLGVHVRFSYYFKLALLSSIGVALILCVLRFDSIFAKSTKVSKRNVPAKTDRKTQRAIHRKRKRIS